jgi:hypothetical protein
MRFRLAAAIALAVAFAATTASAGVVISEDVVVSNQSGTHKSEQTVMLQGNKRKVITKDRIVLTDLDIGRMVVMVPGTKKAGDVPFPPKGVVLVMLAKQGMSIEYKKAAGTHKVAGYDCQDYAGSMKVAHQNIEATECVASAAAGAQEYVAFTKAMAAKLKGSPLAIKGEIPDGIPVSSTVSVSFIPFPLPKHFPPDLTAKYKADLAKQKPEVTRTTVTKIEVKDIAADEFVVPAQYLKPSPVPTAKPGAASSPAAAAAKPGAPAAKPPSH